MNGAVPSHVPSPAVSVWPAPTVPETVGGLVEIGACATTAALAVEVLVVCSPLSAVTTTRTVEPMSAPTSV